MENYKKGSNYEKNNNDIMIYEDKGGITKVYVKFCNEDLWITKYQLADIYNTTRQNIEQHTKNIKIKN